MLPRLVEGNFPVQPLDLVHAIASQADEGVLVDFALRRYDMHGHGEFNGQLEE